MRHTGLVGRTEARAGVPPEAAAMIATEALTRLRLLVGTMRPPLVAGAARDRELPPLQPGQAIQARVEQQSQGGGHLVAVNGRVFELKLPEGTRPGDFLRLVYVNSEPRPTFALLRVERPVDQPDARLSQAGKLLSSLRDIQEGESSGVRSQASAPILPAEFPDTPRAVLLLRDTLSLSGLFYESHQAQWVMGGRTIAQLEQEPQGRLPPLPPQEDPPPQRSVVVNADPADGALPLAEAADLLPAPAAADASAAAQEQDGAPARLPAHPDSFSLIRQQLTALETGHVAWRGEVWPGQTMDWEVGEAPDPEHPEMARVWRTELRLELPRLGEVQARIEFGREGISMQIFADSEDHKAALRENSDALASAFSAAGLSVTKLEIRTRGA